MTWSPLCDQIRESNQRNARTGSIIRFVWHHQASTNDDQTIDMMVTGSRQVSATWTVDNDNPGGRGWSRITGVVPEEFRPWTSASVAVDGRALTVECCNSSGNPTWGIADASFEACARLAAYAYTEYGVPLRRITSLDNAAGHIGHNELGTVFPGESYATFCPGHLDIDRILARAKELLGGGYRPAGGGTPIDEGGSIGGGITSEEDFLSALSDDEQRRILAFVDNNFNVTKDIAIRLDGTGDPASGIGPGVQDIRNTVGLINWSLNDENQGLRGIIGVMAQQVAAIYGALSSIPAGSAVSQEQLASILAAAKAGAEEGMKSLVLVPKEK